MPPAKNIRLTRRRAEVLRLLRQSPPRGFTPFLGSVKDEAALQAFSHLLFGDDDIHPDSLRHGLRGGHSLYFGLKKRDTIAAYCALEFNARQRRAYLVEFGVRDDCRGHGLGLWLLQIAEALARRAACRTLTSHAVSGNAASLALHQSFGFTQLRHIPQYHADGRDSVYMRKVLE